MTFVCKCLHIVWMICKNSNTATQYLTARKIHDLLDFLDAVYTNISFSFFRTLKFQHTKSIIIIHYFWVSSSWVEPTEKHPKWKRGTKSWNITMSIISHSKIHICFPYFMIWILSMLWNSSSARQTFTLSSLESIVWDIFVYQLCSSE